LRCGSILLHLLGFEHGSAAIVPAGNVMVFPFASVFEWFRYARLRGNGSGVKQLVYKIPLRFETPYLFRVEGFFIRPTVLILVLEIFFSDKPDSYRLRARGKLRTIQRLTSRGGVGQQVARI